MRHWVLALIVGLASAAAMAGPTPALTIPSGTYASDPTHTSLHWRIKHMGLSYYTARMNDVTIAVNLDAADFVNSNVTAEVNAASVDTGYPGTDKDFDAEVANDARFLHAEAHPTIRFNSTRILIIGPQRALVDGELTLRGITIPVQLTATMVGTLESHPFAKQPALGISATGMIDRTAFGLDFLSGEGLADSVEILIEAELIKK